MTRNPLDDAAYLDLRRIKEGAIGTSESMERVLKLQRDDLKALVRELRAALVAYQRAYPHNAPSDCFATGPMTGDAITDLVACPGCDADRLANEALAKSAEPGEKKRPQAPCRRVRTVA